MLPALQGLAWSGGVRRSGAHRVGRGKCWTHAPWVLYCHTQGHARGAQARAISPQGREGRGRGRGKGRRASAPIGSGYLGARMHPEMLRRCGRAGTAARTTSQPQQHRTHTCEGSTYPPPRPLHSTHMAGTRPRALLRGCRLPGLCFHQNVVKCGASYGKNSTRQAIFCKSWLEWRTVCCTCCSVSVSGSACGAQIA
eukprot:gene25601-biopygen1467